VSQDFFSERDRKDYKEIKELYPKELVCGFPDVEKLIYMELDFPRGQYRNYIHVAVKKTEHEILQLKEQLKVKSKAIYTFSDSCSLIIDYEPNLYTDAPFKLTMCDSSSMAQKLPIPNFEFLFELSVVPHLFDDVTLYVLDAEKGKFLDDKCLSKNGVGLPDEWLHGYSKGILISGKLVFYWLEVW
jgi:hypothetical protein